MSSLRLDVTTGRWVIIAPRRADRPVRPERMYRPAVPSHDPGCPFCPGNEDRTPPEVLRTPGPNGGWDQRVFPNLYPALDLAGVLEGDGAPRRGEMPGVGVHEVVVVTPYHDERIEVMPVERVAGFLRVFRDRSVALASEPWSKAVTVFVNFGERAGISLAHPHGQILATPVLPPRWTQWQEAARRYRRDLGRSLYDDLRDGELRSRERIVSEGERFVAIAPFASSTAYETWILPRDHRAWFGDVPDEELTGLGEMIRDVLGALRAGGGDPDFNLLVVSAPHEDADEPGFLWHVRVIPRTTTPAGFELATGISIATLAPEDAAADLREALAAPETPERR